VQSFSPEPFWYIYLALETPEDGTGRSVTTEFTWSRGRLFEFPIALAIYEMVLGSPLTRVISVQKKPTKKWKPLPLTTVELQKSCSRILRLAPKKILDVSNLIAVFRALYITTFQIADSLYQKGFLSYPRTETDQYDSQFNFAQFIEKQVVDIEWGQFATR
jgi:DNA topoisomerase-3